ncbi:GNAT family N-acetyltransferase [Palleronia caenipelagi]|uniref:GNAT family N-acetyltransferase n=1 Tax=Palleronia caenipelagi TaxID=2489174 RepID=A0A547PNU7_9RHOB|nr:GNAT family N-acetyltransferase [Palleronia caenipelagi]TRD15795.1 GNAT family N-acetyltransferase [Palleronia caenipelagi]
MDKADPIAQFVDLFSRHPSEALIANLTTRVERLDLPGLSVPMTINDGGLPGNCYICNPITGYTEYAVEETRNFVSHPLLRHGLTSMIRGAAPLVRATRLDRAVQVNNWLFSTNPAPRIDRRTAADLRDCLLARFPDHAVIMRSLNTLTDADALKALSAEGFVLVPARQVYLFDGRIPSKLRRDVKNDRGMLQRTSYVHVGNDAIGAQDYERCAVLYRLLYLEKYPSLNPQYLPDFIAEMHRRALIELEGFRDEDGTLIAFGARFQIGATLTQPLLGYDTGRPQKDGLYRMVTALAQRAAQDRCLLFNQSAGAAGFKRQRGAVPAIEYNAVYMRHLPTAQRVALRGVAGLLAGIGVPLLRRFEL